MADAAYAIARALRAGADTDQDLDTVGVILTNAVKVILSSPGSGRWYGTHQASAPGEAPAVDSGDYRGSWKWDRTTNKVRVFSHGVEPFERPEYLEMGTRYMRPRPHLRPAVEQTKPLIPRIMAAGVANRESAQAKKDGGTG